MKKSLIRWWQKWNFCRRRFRQLWKESSCSRWYGDKKAPRQICLGRLLHNSGMVLCIFLCIIGFAQCPGKLITTGGVFHATVNTGDTAFHFFNSHALNQTGNCLKISLTAAGEFNIFNHISVQLHFDLWNRCLLFCKYKTWVVTFLSVSSLCLEYNNRPLIIASCLQIFNSRILFVHKKFIKHSWPLSCVNVEKVVQYLYSMRVRSKIYYECID